MREPSVWFEMPNGKGEIVVYTGEVCQWEARRDFFSNGMIITVRNFEVAYTYKEEE